MSMTIEFYSALPDELVSLFAAEPVSEDDFSLFETLETLPHAEFPGRLLLPDDLDSLCVILQTYNTSIPKDFSDLCVKQLWTDDIGIEGLTELSPLFTTTLATLSEGRIHEVAVYWAKTFHLNEPLEQSWPYQAVVALQKVARDAHASQKSLILYLSGSPEFFSYLRDL